MKKILLAFIFLLNTGFLSAQKVTIQNNIENIGDGYNMAFKVTIPYTTEKSVTKKWSGFLKDNHAKVKSSKGNIRGENTVINGLGADTMQVYSRVAETGNDIQLVAGFQRNGLYINPTDNPVDNELLTKLLYDLALTLSHEGIEERALEADKVFKDKTKEQSNLIRENEKLSSSNEKMKKNISQNEDEIEKNIRRLDDLKKEIADQQNAIEGIKNKKTELDAK